MSSSIQQAECQGCTGRTVCSGELTPKVSWPVLALLQTRCRAAPRWMARSAGWTPRSRTAPRSSWRGGCCWPTTAPRARWVGGRIWMLTASLAVGCAVEAIAEPGADAKLPLSHLSCASFCPLAAERAAEQVNAALGAGVLGWLRTGVVESVPMQVGGRASKLPAWVCARGAKVRWCQRPLLSALSNTLAQPASNPAAPLTAGRRRPPARAVRHHPQPASHELPGLRSGQVRQRRGWGIGCVPPKSGGYYLQSSALLCSSCE